MVIQRKENDNVGEFYLENDGKKIGEMSYRFDHHNRMVINHTEVFDAEQGKGLAKELVKAGVEFAREKNYEIVALCTYAKHVIDRNPEYRDILADH